MTLSNSEKTQLKKESDPVTLSNSVVVALSNSEKKGIDREREGGRERERP